MTRLADLGGFLIGSLVKPFAADATTLAGERKRGNTLDIHVHLAGNGDAGSGCRLSTRFADRVVFKVLMRRMRVWERAQTFDEGYVLAVAELLRDSSLDKGAVMGLDAVYHRNGKPDWRNTHVYVPNDYVFEVVSRYPDVMVPCVSVNPDRADAIDELERCVEKGARGLKLLGPSQGIDLADKRHTEFFLRCAERNVVLIIHTGCEHTIPVLDNRLGHPGKLELALDQGCTVVACHCATNLPWENPKTLPEYLKLLRKYPNLWGDTAGLSWLVRSGDFRRLRRDDLAVERLVHGSDFPVPPHALPFLPDIGLANLRRVRRIQNPLTKDLALKTALGVGQAAAERAYQLLCGPI
ncbi:MAG: amidohydrolase family protein [Planctomycetota bacterium]|jgi:predicted TIM-barrel fold metal-dependent hydrolase